MLAKILKLKNSQVIKLKSRVIANCMLYVICNMIVLFSIHVDQVNNTNLRPTHLWNEHVATQAVGQQI